MKLRFASSLLFLFVTSRASAIVLSELHYHPAEGSELEFVEVYNPRGEPVDLAGWAFTDGIEYVFPPDAVVAAEGFIIVCRDRQRLSEVFGLPAEQLYGDYEGSLSNGGERVELKDAFGGTIESFLYDDSLPWPENADGPGGSLERLCVSSAAQHPGNWSADAQAGPTPLAPNVAAQCPPPAVPPPTIGINEINYHALGDDELEEYVELRNNTDAPVNLSGYSFTDGISYAFGADTLIAPGGLAIVARNREYAEANFGLDDVPRAPVFGDFQGQLSNSGERLTLVDSSGAVVDSVRYTDGGLWPGAADGLGHSLEKLIPAAVTDDPASWRESSPREGPQWRRATLRGEAIGNVLRVYVNEPGEFLIDNVTLAREDEPQSTLFENGRFDTGISPWVVRGNHEQSGWLAGAGPDGSGALHVISTGRGGASNALVYTITNPLLGDYILTFDYAHISGSKDLFVRLANSTAGRGLYYRYEEGPVISPGRDNGRALDQLPPFVEETRRLVQQPTSSDAVAVTARVRAFEPLGAVDLIYRLDDAESAETIVRMADDGRHDDGALGDGVFGAVLPPQPHNTAVIFKIRAVDQGGRTTLLPSEVDPAGFFGYYVSDNQPTSRLPVYTLLFNHTEPLDPLNLRTRLGGCELYQEAALAYRGDLFFNIGLRRRGGSVCGDINVIKPYMKVKFNPGWLFEGQRKINLQSLWTDKSLTREPMSWQMFESLGYPSCNEEYIRLHINGEYFGLYATLEQPDARFLDRSRLNRSGNLYKAFASREEHYNELNVRGAYEKKTNENNDFSDLVTFLDELHTTASDQLVEWFSRRLDEDRMIDYQVGHILIANTDYFHKNHFLYHDTDTGRWMPLLWDLDLTFGKSYSATNGGVLHDLVRDQAIGPWFSTSLEDGGRNHLQERFFTESREWYGRAYLIRLWDAIEEKLRLDLLEDELVERRDLLFSEQAEDIALWGRSQTFADEPDAPAEFLPNLDRVRRYVALQRRELVEFFQEQAGVIGHARLKITEIQFDAAGDDEDAEWLELWNPTGREIDVSGWSIEGIDFAFPAGTRIREGEVFVVARSADAFRARYGTAVRVFGDFAGRLDSGGEILRVKDAGPGYPATVDFLRYVSDGVWPAGARGDGYTLELAGVSPYRDNDAGENWRRSLALGGSPGDVEGITSTPRVMVRPGDVNADAKLNITDAILILQVLFHSDEEPTCRAALDIDRDAQADISDAIALLAFLFEGDTVPIPRECVVADDLECRESHCVVADG